MSAVAILMSSRYSQLFWGLLLVVLDFSINNFDLLPDLLGYVILMFGCSGLLGVSPSFSRARLAAGILVLLSVIQFFNPTPSAAFGLVWSIADACMIWWLLGGIMDQAKALERPDLRTRASNRRVAYVFLMALAALAGLDPIDTQISGSVIGIGLVVGILIVCVLILHLIHRVGRELSTDDI